MNKAYRNVWNEATGTFVAVAENVKARGKRSSSAKKLAGAALAVAALGSAGVAHATVTIGDSTAPGVWDGTEIVFDGAGSSISFTNGGSIDFGATGGTVTNLSNAALNAGSKDAVTGQQLYNTNQDVGTLQTNVGTLNTNVGTLQTNVGTLNTNVGTLQTNVGTLNTNVGTLQTNVGTLNTNVGTLQTNVGTLNTNVGTLQTNVSSAQTDITSLQDSLALLQGGNATAGYTGAKFFRVNSDLDDAAATGDDSVAIGPDAVAAGNSALAAGVAASAAGANAVATGAGASASGARAVASGYQAKAEGVAAIAIGDASLAVGDGTIALGDAASVDSEFVQHAIAIGTDAKVTGNSSSSAVALGAAAHASAAAATALGAGAQASAANAIALGNSKASSGNALAAGNGAFANSPNAISLGADAGVGTNGTLAADRTSHIAIGTRAGQNVVGNQTVAMGFEAGSNIDGDQNIALGTQAGSGIDGDFNVALGYQANRNAGAVDHAVALGALTTAGRDAVAAGYGAEASSEGSIAIGTNSHVSSGQGVALGRNATASGSSVALGTNSVAGVDDANGVGFLTGSNFAGGSVISVGYRDSGSGQSQQRRVVNVADGSQAYDAVNVRQLQATQESVANLIGAGVTVSADGAFSNLIIGQDANGDDVTASSVGDAFAKLSSGAVANIVPADVVKYNGTGQINNVTAGTLGSDAVNVAQLNAAVADNSAKYFSVNSSNPANRDNTGATGSNAIAIGPEAGATADSAVAQGYRARAEAKESVAVGYNANALGENSSVLGNTSFAYDKGGVAIGQTARSTGLNSIVVGTNAQADKKDPNQTVDNAIVVGTDAEVSADDGIAIGHRSLANQLRGIAQGYDASSTGVDATAIGSNSIASATNAYASGTRASASGTSAIASGTDARGYANNAIAMGNNAVSGRVVVDPTDAPQNFDTIAIGSSSLADSRHASALGRGARATAEEALAIGDAASVSGSYSTGVGNENTVTGSQSLATGYRNTVSGSSSNAVGHTNQVAGAANSVLGNTNVLAASASAATAVGNENSIAATNAGAFGNDNTLTNRASNSRVVGNGNQVTAANSFVVGNGNELNVTDAFVIGNGSSVTVQSGVALGSGSASTTAARDGYVPNAGKTNQQSAVVATRSTTGAIAVGSSTVRRQITGLAAGTADTDAVNVAQLKATGWNVQTDGDASTHVSTGEGHTVDIGVASAENNLTVTRTTTGNTTTIDYALKKNLDLGAAGSVKTGNTTLNNAGVQIANGGSTTNLGAGSLSVSNGTNTVSVNSGTGTVNGLTNRTFTPGSIVNGQAATEDQLGQVRNDLIADGFALEDENGNKVQKSLGQAVAVVGDGNIETIVQNGELVVGLADNVNVANNLTVGGNSSVAGNSTVGGTLNVAGATTLNNTLNVAGATTLAGGATIGNNLTVNGGTNVNFGGNVLHGVAEGVVGTDAVNVNQLNNTRTDIINEGFALKAADGQTVKKNLGEAIDVVGGDTNVSTLVEGGQVKVKLADNVSVQSNLAVGGNSNVAGNSTVGGTLNVAGATTLAGGATINGATINNSLNVSNGATINMGGNKVGGVGAGEVSSTSQEAVNGSQLFDVANRPLGFSADQGSNVSRKLGETLAINGADSNIVTKTTPANGIEIELAKNLDLGAAGSVKTGNTTLNNAGVQIANGGSTTTLGAGQLSVSNGTNTVVVNSNTGTVNGLTNKTFNPNAFTSGQAATEDQLKLVSDVANTGWNLSTEGVSTSNVAPGETVDLASSDGNIVITKGLNDENVKFALAKDLNVTNVNAAGNLTVAGTTNLGDSTLVVNKGNVTVAPNTTVNMGGNKITNVAAGTDDTDAVNLGQLKDVGQDVTDLANTPLTFTAESGTPLDRKLGQEVAFTGSNSNLSTSTTANGVEIALADNLDLGANGSVKTGDTLVNNAGVKVGQNVTLTNDGLRIANGPSITAGGIDAGDKFITNVKAGVSDQDAVNVSQLKGVEAIANTGWNVTANGQNSTNVKPGDTVDLTDVDGNIVVAKGTATNPHQVTFGLSDSISIKDNLTVGGNSNVAGNSTVGGTLNVAGASTLAGGATISNNLTVAPNTTVNMGGNKITNVARGTDGQDAVNVSQLNELADTALNFTDDAGVVVSRKLGETLALEGADANITTKATADGIAIELAKNLDLGATGSVKLGDTTVSNAGLVIANGPSVTNNGINAGGSKITNVADGEISATSKDAINGSQLKQVSDVANTGWNLSTEGANASNVAPGETVDLASSDGNIVITKGLNDENVKFALAKDLNVTNVNVAGNTSIAGNLAVAGTTNLGDSTLVVNKGNVTVAPNTTVNMGGNKITNVAKGTDGTDAVNKDQLDELANTPLTFTAESGTPLDRKLGQEVAFTGSNSNLSTSTTANGVEIALADNLDLGASGSVKTGDTLVNNAGVKVGQNVALTNDGLRIANGPSITAGGIDAGDKFITNVKAGVNDQDAVNVSQLKGVEAIANTGWNVTANGQNSTNVKPGDTVDLTDADGNLVVAKGTATNPHQVTFGLSDNLNLNTVNVSNNLTVAGTTNLGNSTLVVKEGDIKVAGGTTVNMGGNKITNVAKGTDGTDAVNKDQLDELANTGLTFAANAGTVSKKLGETVGIKGTLASNAAASSSNIRTEVNGAGEVEILLANNLDLGDLGSVKTGETTVNNAGVKVGNDVTLGNTGLIIANGPSVTRGGINAGGLKITNVADGEISATSKDAINGSQLKAVSDVANTGWNVSVNGNAGGERSQVKPGDTVDFANDDGNVVITKRPDENDIKVNLAKDLTLDSVTTGQTVLNNDGVKVGNDVFLNSTGLTAGNVIISSVTGINAGGFKITNVAAGTDDTDAVNVSQLKQVQQNVDNLGDRAVKYDGNVGDPKNQITLEGDVSTDGGKTGGTKITNVARGDISENSTDAINGSQIKEMGDSIADGMGGGSKFENGKLVTELNVGGNTYNNVNDALNGVNNDLNTRIDDVEANAGWQIDTNGEGASKVATGKTVNFVNGSNIEITRETTANGDNNVTVGLAQDITVNSVTAKEVTADKVKAKEVVIENGPTIKQDGIDMAGKAITNVAEGRAPTDAVNVSQLQTATEGLQNQVNSVRGDLHKLDNKLSAGVAAAMATAGLPQAYLPGKSMAAMAGGTWNGETGFAIGVSTISDNGSWVMKFSGNTNSRGDYGGAVGVGYQW